MEYTRIDLAESGKGTVALLRRPKLPDRQRRRPVLLIHGASASNQTFRSPGTHNLASYLMSVDMIEPWLLDWRGSRELVEEFLARGDLERLRSEFDFEQAAEHDIPLALEFILRERKAARLDVVGFCMGAGVLAHSVAIGQIRASVSCMVLLTLGLFYRADYQGLLKAHDDELSRLLHDHNVDPVVDPHADQFTAELESLYERWYGDGGLYEPPHPRTTVEMAMGGQPGNIRPPEPERVCNRVSFIYGVPYTEANLPQQIHDQRSEHCLLRQFGAIPMRMLLHGVRNVRRGWAGAFGANKRDTSLVSDDARLFFGQLKKITLITGHNNRIWHRDSVIDMYEWLSRDPKVRVERPIIVPEYGHQDLLWGRNAESDIYPYIHKGLCLSRS